MSRKTTIKIQFAILKQKKSSPHFEVRRFWYFRPANTRNLLHQSWVLVSEKFGRGSLERRRCASSWWVSTLLVRRRSCISSNLEKWSPRFLLLASMSRRSSTKILLLWDVGGQDKSALWRHYYQNTQGLIFVVANDRDRVEAAREELHRWSRMSWGCSILVFANKQDLPNAMTAAEITDKLGLHQTRNWYIQATCATGISLRGTRLALCDDQ